MVNEAKKGSRWLWTISAVLVFSLTGCSMYPRHPGLWPAGPWGSLLRIVSDGIDWIAHHIVGGNYGVALLIATVLVRLLILPLFVKQIRYSKVMQAMQPEIKDIRTKYQGDNQKIQEETMKLWKREGVNPMTGCLPMIVQLPILYALFGAIEGNIGLSTYNFLGIWVLGKPDTHFILPVLAAITTYLSQRVVMTNNDSQTKMMLIIMPIFVLLIGTRFASGLALYWVFTNLFTAVQSYFVKVRPAKAEAGAAQVVVKPDKSGGARPQKSQKPGANRQTTKSAKSADAKPSGGDTADSTDTADAADASETDGAANASQAQKSGNQRKNQSPKRRGDTTENSPLEPDSDGS